MYVIISTESKRKEVLKMTNERAYVEGKEIVCETKRLYVYKTKHLGKTWFVVALKNMRVGDLGWYYSKETAIREMKYFETFKYLPNEF
jgi:hypothetical protein